MTHIILLIAIVLCTISCAENSGEISTSAVKKDSVANTIKTNQNSLNEPKIINDPSDVPSKSFPIVDSTNFDNYSAESGIKNNLFIDEIKFQKKFPDAENIRLRYFLNYATKFTSVAISYNKGEHELVTTLVNIDQNNTIIDHLDIAYDEIAESALRKISTISKANIVVEDWNYFNENNQKTTKTYFVTSDGKFQIN